MEIGERLRQLGTGGSMTLLDAEGKTGFSVSCSSDIERCRTRPSPDAIKVLARCAYSGPNRPSIPEQFVRGGCLGSELKRAGNDATG